MEASVERGSRTSYIPTLDGWRAVAVSLVIGAHCSKMLTNNGSTFALRLNSLFDHAGYGVDIFFALSGFLICTLLLREKERRHTISLWRFYARRAFRILPPMLLYLACIAFLSFRRILPSISAYEFASVLFFFRNYASGTWYTGHFWSLAVEEHFYALVPLFISLLSKWAAILGAIALIAACIGIHWFEHARHMFPGTAIVFRTENRFDGLMWGCLLAFALQSPKATAWLRRRLNVWVFVATIAASIVVLTASSSRLEHRAVVAAVMPVLIAYTVLHSESIVGRVLEFSVLRWIGRISYSLYLWQMLFLPQDDRPLGALQSFPVSLIMPVVCAALSFYLLEKPMMRLGHRLAGSPGAKPSGRGD
jgi:peptidoglycan/LPS O-acetylase OafA/YrhL